MTEEEIKASITAIDNTLDTLGHRMLNAIFNNRDTNHLTKQIGILNFRRDLLIKELRAKMILESALKEGK